MDQMATSVGQRSTARYEEGSRLAKDREKAHLDADEVYLAILVCEHVKLPASHTVRKQRPVPEMQILIVKHNAAPQTLQQVHVCMRRWATVVVGEGHRATAAADAATHKVGTR
jgi:hypothetical protein